MATWASAVIAPDQIEPVGFVAPSLPERNFAPSDVPAPDTVEPVGFVAPSLPERNFAPSDVLPDETVALTRWVEDQFWEGWSG